MNQTESYVNTNDILKQFRIHRSTLYKLIKKGLPALHLGRRAGYRFKVTEVEQWLKSHGGK